MPRIHRGFTIMELLGAVIIISMTLLSILGLLRIAIPYTNKAAQETIAISLAREGMEGIYVRRDTNRLKRSAEKDKYRLCAKEETLPGVGCAYRLSGGNTLHRLGYQTGAYGKTPYYTKSGTIPNIETSILGSTGFLLSTGDFIGGTSPDAAGNFYRAIIGIGLYQKDTNVTGGKMIECINGDASYNGIDMDGATLNPSGQCGDTHAKEFRFCSRVEYQKSSQSQGKVEFCGGITNYQE